MDALRAAVPLSRLFLALADSERLSEVRVRARSRTAIVRLDRGCIVSIDGVDGEPLGDALMRAGGLDRARHEAALAGQPPPAGRIGPWLVAVGAASPQAVGQAMEAQLAARLALLLRWSEPSFELVSKSALGRASEETMCSPVVAGSNQACEGPQVRVGLTLAVWRGLVQLCRDLPAGQLSALAGENALKLTSSGRRIVGALERSEHVELVAWLARSPQSALCAPRAVLRVLGAAVDETFDGDACNLLLRKQREIRRRVGPHALLDLPAHARSDQARPALRRLAQKLHPDRFHTVEPALRAASQEVMRALSQAERELLASPARSR